MPSLRRYIVLLYLVLALFAPVLAAVHETEHDLGHDDETVCELCLLAGSGGQGTVACPAGAEPFPAAVPTLLDGITHRPCRIPWLSQPVRAPPPPASL